MRLLLVGWFPHSSTGSQHLAVVLSQLCRELPVHGVLELIRHLHIGPLVSLDLAVASAVHTPAGAL